MSLASGARLGPYEILTPLGAGGMGEVFHARDTRLGRGVAIKVLPDAVSRDPRRLSRFEREARLLAALNHPNVASLYEFEQQDGIRFLVMELVPGETLRELLKRERPGIREALEIGRQVATALEAAHARGIVHRDLKPENVKRTPDGTVKLLDFGLAKALESATPVPGNSSDSTVPGSSTEGGAVVGTAAYMSPEQARGLAVDQRTDIWSFGCLLYELLAGRPAFRGSSLSDVLVGILERAPDWDELPSAVPEKVRVLLDRCLAKDAALRLRDVGDARLEIEDVLSGAVRGGSRPAGKARARKSVRAKWAFLAAALVLLFAVTWAVRRGGRPAPAGPLPGAKVLAVLPFRDLSGDAGGQLVSDGLVETLGARLAREKSLQVFPPASAGAAPREADAAKLGRQLGANLVLRGTVQRSGDLVRISYLVLLAKDGVPVGGDTVTGASSDLFALQDRVAESVLAVLKLPAREVPFRAVVPGGRDAQDSYLRALGHLQRYDSEPSVDAAITLLEGLARDAGGSAAVQAALGRAYLDKFYNLHELSWAESAKAACSRAAGLDPELPEVSVTLGKILVATGKPAEAADAFNLALARSPGDVEALFGLAEAEQARGRTAEAEGSLRSAIALRPESWMGYNRLGYLFSSTGDWLKASDAFQKVVSLAPDNTIGWNNLAQALLVLGRLDEASAAARRSLGAGPTSLAHSTLGNVEYLQGHFTQAAESFRKAVSLAPADFVLWFNLAEAERWAPGLSSRSAESYGRAISLAEGELRVNPRDSSILASLAVSLAKTGRLTEARKRIQEALAVDPDGSEALYQAAVVAEVTGDRRRALELLRHAILRGCDRSRITRDPELRNLAADPAFLEQPPGFPGVQTPPAQPKGGPR